MPQNYVALTYPYPYKNLSGTASGTLANTYGGIGAIPAADGNGSLYAVNTVAPAYNSALTFSNTNVAPVFTPILSGGANIVTAPSLGAVGYVLSVGAGNTTAWVTVSSLPVGDASTLETATWEAPGTIGSTTPNTGAFTQVTATSMSNTGVYDVSGKIAGQTDIFRFGNTSANNNKGVINWNYVGNGSASNNMGFGFWGANNILKLNAGGLITLTVPSGTTNICDMLIPTLAGSATRRFGRATSTGDQMIETFNYTSANSASNYYSLAVGSNALQLSNSTSTASTLASPLSSTGVLTGSQLTSTVSNGTAPLIVTSSTKVANLYVDRAAVADTVTTVTTNANLTGDIVSVGNATTYTAALPVAIGGTGGTGGFASPSAIGNTVANTGAFTTITSAISGGLVGLAISSTSNPGTNQMTTMFSPNTASLQGVQTLLGRDSSNCFETIFVYIGNNSASNYSKLSSGTNSLTMYNSNTTSAIMESPFKSKSAAANASVGTLATENTNTDPDKLITAYAANQGVGKTVRSGLGKSASSGNSAEWGFTYQGNNSATNSQSLQFFGGGGTLTMYNSTSTASTFNTPLKASSYESTATLGSALLSMLKEPNVNVYFGGSSGTYTPSSPTPDYIKVQMVGGGGGGGGCGAFTTGSTGSSGGDTQFTYGSIWKAKGGAGGQGAGSIGSSLTDGGSGGQFTTFGGLILSEMYGQRGASQPNCCGGGNGLGGGTNPGLTGGINSDIYGGGGSGANASSTSWGGGGGGSGFVEFMIDTPTSTYAYSVGNGGAGGAAGTAGYAGGNGGGGRIVITEYWQ